MDLEYEFSRVEINRLRSYAKVMRCVTRVLHETPRFPTDETHAIIVGHLLAILDQCREEVDVLCGGYNRLVNIVLRGLLAESSENNDIPLESYHRNSPFEVQIRENLKLLREAGGDDIKEHLADCTAD